jgi:hypothetical protein
LIGVNLFNLWPMSTSLTSEPNFVCDCGELIRSSCRGEQFYKQHEGKRYCVLHFPGKDKSTDFKKVFQRKLDSEDFDFQGVWFPDDIEFFNFYYSKAARFGYATFTGSALFRSARFSAVAGFASARFSAEADFSGAEFSAVADFSYANFTAGADFSFASFRSRADFSYATFGDHLRFAAGPRYPVFAERSSLSLAFSRIEKPHLASFHTLTLSPRWFVNVDARKLEFTNVDWIWRSTKREIESIEQRRVSSGHRMLSIACRNLAVNAEENHRYEEASKFRYMAMDARRLEHWRGFDFRRLSWWYWLASGYGERVLRALVMLVAIMLVSAALYTQVGFARWEPRIASESEVATATRDEIGAPLKLARALTYSAAVMTFQRPEPRPATTAAHTIVLLETILGPVQAALLALAIRRKFMR